MSDDSSNTSTPRGGSAPFSASRPEQRPDGLTRTLDSRFSRVQALLAPQPGTTRRPARPTPQDDAYVRQMREYLLLYRNSAPTARQQLAVRFPGPCGAMQIRDKVARELLLVVQCRILARQTDAKIAQKTALDPVAIHWYEKLFFNVRDLLDAPEWVEANVLDVECLQRLSPQEGALKRAAYLHGAEFFDTLHAGAPQRDVLDESADLENDLEAAAFAGTRRRIALLALDPANHSTKEVVQLVRQLQALVARKQAMQAEISGQITTFTNAVRHTLDQINFIKGDMAVEYLKKHNPNLLEYDSGAVELRDHQVYAVTSGNLDAVAHLKDKKFPPPPVRREAAPVRDDVDPLYDSPGATE